MGFYCSGKAERASEIWSQGVLILNLDSVVYLGAMDTLLHLQTSVTTAIKWAEQYPPELVLWWSEHWRAKSKEPLVRTIQSEDSGEGDGMPPRKGSQPAGK